MYNQQTHRLIIIIPTYNESKNIKKVLLSLNTKYNVLIVNDGSTDDTNFYSPEYINIKIINHNKNLGYDAALCTGFKYAYKKNYNYALSFDADNQFYEGDIKKMSNFLIKNNLDIVIGKRKNFQRVAERFSGFLFKIFFNIEDPFCGLKIYNLNNISKKNFFSLESKNFFGLQFLKIFILKKNYKNLNIKVRKRIDKSRLSNPFFTNIKMIYSCFFILLTIIFK
jgi:glycosyltransferase involved in cell wall biosynthesis